MYERQPYNVWGSIPKNCCGDHGNVNIASVHCKIMGENHGYCKKQIHILIHFKGLRFHSLNINIYFCMSPRTHGTNFLFIFSRGGREYLHLSKFQIRSEITWVVLPIVFSTFPSLKLQWHCLSHPRFVLQNTLWNVFQKYINFLNKSWTSGQISRG